MRRTKIFSSVTHKPDATAMYRAMPYERLDVDITYGTDRYIQWCDIYNADICFFQRPASQKYVLDIETCKRFNKPVIVDFDDFTLQVDNETNPAFEYFSKDATSAAIRECIRLADIVTVSTQGLKDAFLEEVSGADIRVIPNAVDDTMFSLKPSYHERNKIILLRGGGSHKYDWEAYKDGIIEILKTFPEYKLAVMGYHPEWLREIPSNQIQYYQFTDIPTYFETLMELKPEIMIVPLIDDKFNRCKSAISVFEGVLSGAAVMASRLPEMENYGACLFENNVQLPLLFDDLQDKEIWEYYYDTQLQAVPRLSDVNELRKDIIEELLTRTKKYTPITKKVQPATDKEFHDYSLSHGHTQDEPHYQKAHGELAEYFIRKVRPKYALELGCGTGATLIELLKRGVMTYGIELNPYSFQYIQEHHPMFAHSVTLGDLTKEEVILETELGKTKADLVFSIEVFEHINKPEEWWEGYLTDLSGKFKYFYFSSTPYNTTESFDLYWGHSNVRRTSDWIGLFEKSGWKFVENPKIITSWDCLFCSKN